MFGYYLQTKTFNVKPVIFSPSSMSDPFYFFLCDSIQPNDAHNGPGYADRNVLSPIQPLYYNILFIVFLWRTWNTFVWRLLFLVDVFQIYCFGNGPSTPLYYQTKWINSFTFKKIHLSVFKTSTKKKRIFTSAFAFCVWENKT